MQTPQKNAPQSARRSSKQHGPKSEVHKSVQSDTDTYLVSGQEGDQTSSRKNRKPRKKSNARKNGVQSDVGEVNEHQGHRHASHGDKHKHTPGRAIKSDAYAGPTFHQSPAASALPPPSFLSRSVPTSKPISTIAEHADSSPDDKQEVFKELEEKREPTPLDWMFEAARQGKSTPNGVAKGQLISPPAESPASRREESDFPFELEGTEDENSVYTTPLSQRFAASKTPQSISVGGQPLSDAERKVKTDALKQALLKSPDSGQLEPAFNDNNPFNAKNAPASSPFSPRHTSNPTTPSYVNGYGSGQNNYFQYGATSPGRNYNYQQTSRPPSSNLRNVYEPGFGAPLSPPNTVDSRISTARSPQPSRALNFGAIYGGTASRPQSEGNPVGHNAKPSLEQGLDDLKKALNMNFLGQT